MKLVVIDNQGKVLKVYDNSCSISDVDQAFEDYKRLVLLEQKITAKPQPQVVQFSRADMEAMIRRTIELTTQEIEARKTLLKKAERWLDDRQAIAKSQFKVWLLNGLRKALNYILNRKKKSTSK